MSALIGVTTSVVQAGVLRGAAWAARGLRVPARNALLADVVPAQVYGRAYGFERTMDNLGAIVGPLLALGLVSLLSVRTAIVVSVIPGLLAAAAIVYAIRQANLPKVVGRKKLRFQVRPVLKGQMGRVMAGFTAFEVGNVAATLLILRATDALTPGHGVDAATQIAIALYVVYNVAATITSFPAGGLLDMLGRRGPLLVTATGVAAFLASAARRPPNTPRWPPSRRRRFAAAFGVLATVQSIGNVAASAIAGLLYTVASSMVAFVYLAVWMLIALATLAWAARSSSGRTGLL